MRNSSQPRPGDDSAEPIDVRLSRLRRAAAALREVSDDALLGRIERIVAAWCDPAFEFRRRAVEELPAVTGFSAAMIDRGLALHFEALRGEALGRLLDSELAERGGRTRVADLADLGLVVHLLAGNLPGIGIVPTLLALATRRPSFVKAAAGDPVFPLLFAESVRVLDPDLGSCTDAAYWPGGEGTLEEVLLREAETVVAWGSDAAIAAIAPRVRGRFVGHGHKVSFAALSREVLGDATARDATAERLALDTALWDQQGCLSPQVVYLEGGDDEADSHAAFVKALGVALDRLTVDLPTHTPSLAERAAVQHFRDEAEWRPGNRWVGGTGWGLRIEDDPAFLPSCLNRHLRVKTVRDLRGLPSFLGAHRRWLEACGLAAPLARRMELGNLLRECGVNRVCAIGEMQNPPLSWRPGGVSRITA